METVDNQKKMDESSASVVATEPTSTTDPSLTSAAPVEADHPLSKAWSAVHHAVGLVASFDAFTALVSEAEALKDLTNIRAALSALVTAFPLCWGYWTRWARHERQATAAAVAEGGEEAAAKEARKRARDVLQQGTEQAEQVHELWTAYVSELITGLQHGDVEAEEVRRYNAHHQHCTAFQFTTASHDISYDTSILHRIRNGKFQPMQSATTRVTGEKRLSVVLCQFGDSNAKV